ncbi:MAG: Uma2 family endonuclease [Halothece sp.]
MSRVTNLQIPTDTWVVANWEEYLQVLDSLGEQKTKSYYYCNHIRLEMLPVSNDHARDHSIILYAVNLFATLKNIKLNSNDNCSYRKPRVREAQPDISFYIGNSAKSVPWGTGIVNLDKYPPPNLVIEVAKTSLFDDQGNKRSLYEALGVEEYWIVDVEQGKILAFAMDTKGSFRISQSQVLSELDISLLETALQHSRQISHSEVGAWLLTQFDGNSSKQ